MRRRSGFRQPRAGSIERCQSVAHATTLALSGARRETRVSLPISSGIQVGETSFA
jgi:hypothetical protein